jgi:hypothetical protein
VDERSFNISYSLFPVLPRPHRYDFLQANKAHASTAVQDMLAARAVRQSVESSDRVDAAQQRSMEEQTVRAKRALARLDHAGARGSQACIRASWSPRRS